MRARRAKLRICKPSSPFRSEHLYLQRSGGEIFGRDGPEFIPSLEEVPEVTTMDTTNSITDGKVLQKDDSKYLAHNLLMKRIVSMALQAVVELGIPDILANAKGRKPMSAEEILQQLPTKSTPGPASVSNLQRLLNPLVREGLFSESLDDSEQPVYGLTAVSEWFIRGNEFSIVPAADMMYHPASDASERCLNEAILDETVTAWEVAHGVPIYEFTQDPEFGSLFQKSMEANSKMYFTETLETLLHSGVLDDVNTLVDVGGGWGSVVGQVVAHKPHIQGINFDLPHVIAAAPAINGVEHIGGNFFESVPSGEAVFLKWIVHNYSDEKVIQILKNCFKSLPAKTGKVIIAEFVMDRHDNSAQGLFVECLDVIMVAYIKGARERTKEEYNALLAAAGFPRSKFIYTPGSITLIEGFKD